MDSSNTTAMNNVIFDVHGPQIIVEGFKVIHPKKIRSFFLTDLSEPNWFDRYTVYERHEGSRVSLVGYMRENMEQQFFKTPPGLCTSYGGTIVHRLSEKGLRSEMDHGPFYMRGLTEEDAIEIVSRMPMGERSTPTKASQPPPASKKPPAIPSLRDWV